MNLFPRDTTFNPIERVTGAVAHIDSNHGQVHAGKAFGLAASGALAQGETDIYTFTVPEDVYLHFQALSVVSDGGNDLTVSLIDETILNATPGGTALTPMNHHRQGHGKRATGVLTVAGAVTNNDTVTIGSRVYTFKTTLTGAANEILIGANAAASVANMVAAINAAAGAGTTYGTGTVVHADVLAYDGPGDTVGIVAKSRGASGNEIVTTETLTNASSIWGAATLTGGVDPTVSNGSNLTVRLDPTIDYIGQETFDTIVMFKQGTVASNSEATRSNEIEWVMKNERTFSVKFANTGSGAGTVKYSFRPFWYEELAA